MQGLCVHFLPCLCSISTAFPLAPAPTDIQLGPINGEKAGLKINIKKTKNMASIPTTLWQIDGETMETITDFILGGSKITTGG